MRAGCSGFEAVVWSLLLTRDSASTGAALAAMRGNSPQAAAGLSASSRHPDGPAPITCREARVVRCRVPERFSISYCVGVGGGFFTRLRTSVPTEPLCANAGGAAIAATTGSSAAARPILRIISLRDGPQGGDSAMPLSSRPFSCSSSSVNRTRSSFTADPNSFAAHAAIFPTVFRPSHNCQMHAELGLRHHAL